MIGKYRLSFLIYSVYYAAWRSTTPLHNRSDTVNKLDKLEMDSTYTVRYHFLQAVIKIHFQFIKQQVC